ncbi:hypothetical protein [Phenylobacterium sp.]|jgi:hypothetical protein|uniref:hypothetical protein n=1 Tax=Phenylobacterium sp. TaxID=1871053 RepID=UPI002F422E2F
MSDHHPDAPVREVLAAQALAIDRLTQTLRRISDAMTVQSEAALAAVGALVAAAHTAAGEITQLKADKAALLTENEGLRAAAEDPAAMKTIIDSAKAATVELTGEAPALQGQSGEDPQPELQPEG